MRDMDSTSLVATELVAAAGATHPRVTLDDIKSAIKSVNFVTGSEALMHKYRTDADRPRELEIFTLCFVVMKNGFVVIGKSAPASSENYDKDKGDQFSYEDAVRQLWPLMGYCLRDSLHANRGNVAEKDSANEGC